MFRSKINQSSEKVALHPALWCKVRQCSLGSAELLCLEGSGCCQEGSMGTGEGV